MTGTPESLLDVTGARATARRFSFAGTVLDERTLELLVHGEPVELEPKPLEVLRHLLLHAGEVVTKDELLAAVWPGRILSETVLTKCIARLRDVLRDDEQQVIKTVHGYGYRLVAPVRVEDAAPPAAAPRFDFKAGDRPPLRPLWSLAESLGQGSHGEVWLVRHDKTREQRVYKFATDGPALHALKREITLYRLMHDALGDQAPSVAALDWNLDEVPYFLEIEYAPGGSLVDWAKAQNGLGQVPMGQRLEIAAQIAEALAAAHSMGVLHKDLKPSNVLIVSAPGEPIAIKLGDFGSGGVLDPARLEAMGITRMGFTQTIKAGIVGGTPLYLAPEVIAGQPATLQADIYALGVILYQLIVGDLWRPMAPGWEQDIADELLREDIAFAAEGHVARRLGTATVLADRLRALNRRRAERAAERMQKSEAEAQRLEVERIRARRGWVRATLGVLAAGLAISLVLFLDARRARDEAAESAGTSKAVSEFLVNDLFASIDAEKRAVRNLTVKQVLDSASARVDERFSARPQVAAELHAALGIAYYTVFDAATAASHLDQARTLFNRLLGVGSEGALDVSARLLDLQYVLGQLPAAVKRAEDDLANGAQRLGRTHPKVLRLRQDLARGYFDLGDWRHAAQELAVLLDDMALAPGMDEARFAEVKTLRGNALLLLGDFPASESLLRTALQVQPSAAVESRFTVASTHRVLGQVLIELGRYAEAETELEAALEIVRPLVEDRDARALSVNLTRSQLRVAQGRYAEALEILGESLRWLATYPPETTDQSFWFRETQAGAYHGLGRLADAESAMRQALDSAGKTLDPRHPLLGNYRIALADILRERGKLAEARELLAGAETRLREVLPAEHPYVADLRRVEGLLLLKEGHPDQARAMLEQALRLTQQHYDANHWRSRRARAELAAVPGTA